MSVINFRGSDCWDIVSITKHPSKRVLQPKYLCDRQHIYHDFIMVILKLYNLDGGPISYFLRKQFYRNHLQADPV